MIFIESDGNILKKIKDILIQFTSSKPVFTVFDEYLKCFKCFNNKMVQGNRTNIMLECKIKHIHSIKAARMRHLRKFAGKTRENIKTKF